MKKVIFFAIVMFSMFFVSCGFDLASDEMVLDGQDDTNVPDEVADEVTDNETPDNEKPDVEKPDNETPDNEKPDVDTDEDIVDEDPTVSIIGPVGINEGESDVITIELSKIRDERTTVYFQFNPDNMDTGIYSRDFSISVPSFQYTIPAGEKSFSFIMKNLENNIVEGNKKVTVKLFSGSSYVEVKNSQIAVLLYDNDGEDSGKFSFASASVEVFEGGEVCVDINRFGGNKEIPASVMIKRNSGNMSDVTVNPSGDYVAGVVITFTAGSQTQKLCVTAVNDGVAEGNEVIEFFLTSPSSFSTIDGIKNTFKITIKDSSSQTKEIVGDNGKELLCTFTKDYGKCHAGSTVFSIAKEYTYHILSDTFYCEGMIAGDKLHCETVGYDYSTDEACKLPGGGVGYTWNADGCNKPIAYYLPNNFLYISVFGFNTKTLAEPGLTRA